MKIKIEINNSNGCNFSKKKLRLAIEKTIQQSYLLNSSFKDVIVSVGFLSPNQIQKINCKYRSKDYVTDILSFANYEGKSDILKKNNSKIFLGELLICCEDIKKYSKKNNILFSKELYRVVSHGTLHLLGFSHSKNMFKIQDKIATEII